MLIMYGSTSNFTVAYDSTLTGGANPDGKALSQAIVDYCEYDLQRLSLLFGNILPPATSLPITINLLPATPTQGGGWNNLVNLIRCYCNANTQPAGLEGLVVAELAEIFMALQKKGWVPNWSNGEALSRTCACILYPDRAGSFQTGNQWLMNGRPDRLDQPVMTDADPIANGCGTLFLNYLAYQLNLPWRDIIAAG
jgi:hypothetical protein